MSAQVSHYRVAGMSCEHCRSAVSGEIGRLPGVRDVEVDLGAGTVTVHGEGIDDDAVRRAVEEAGYEVVP
jgi:copper chaperone CopZ